MQEYQVPTVSRYTSVDVKNLVNREFNKFQSRKSRIDDARKMLQGELKAPLPEALKKKIKDSDLMRIRLAEGTTIPIKTVNVIQRKRPRLQRQQIGVGPKAGEAATHIERIANSLVEQLFDWDSAVDFLFNEGEGAVVVVPQDAHWQNFPTLLDIDGKVRKQFQRDNKGRKSTDEYYRRDKSRTFEPDHQRSTAEYEDQLDDFMARKLPWLVRVIDARSCAPIFSGKNLEGLIIQEKMSKNDLIRRNFIWPKMHERIEPTEETDDVISAGEQLTLYTVFMLDENARPYLVYSVDGKRTEWRSDAPDEPPVDAVIDLYEEYGLTELPVAYEYGWHFASKDPDKRGLPFVWPFIPSLLGIDILSTATVFHTWNTAFSGFGYVPDPKLDPRAWLAETGPRSFTIDPLSVQALPGQLMPIVHPGVNKDVYQMISLMMGSNQKEEPGGSGGAFGAGSAQSGHERSLMRDYLEDAISQVLKGAKNLYAFVGKTLLTYACHLAEKEDMDIPIYVDSKTEPKGTRNGVPNRELLKLSPGDAGIIYDVTAFYPRKPGENMALATQIAEFVKQGLATFDELRETMGDESPEETRIAIAVDQMLFESDLGRQYIYSLAVDYLGDQKMKEILKLQTEGQMTPGGTPTAALSGLFPQGGGPVMTGMGTGASARGQLGGIVSGAMQQQTSNYDAASQASNGSGVANV